MGREILCSPSGLEYCMITPTFEEGREMEPGDTGDTLRFQGFDSEVSSYFSSPLVSDGLLSLIDSSKLVSSRGGSYAHHSSS